MHVYAYGAGRRLGVSTLQADEPADPVATLFSPEIGLLNANEWLLRLDFAAKSDPEGPFRAQFERVRSMLIDILPDVSDIRIRPPDRGSLVSRRSLENVVLFRTHYGEVPFPELSLGYQAMLAWLVDFASRMFDRYPDSEDPLAQPAVALIDELDLHLHPRWQQQITDYLTRTFPRTQFVVTAHSPLVVQAAEDANIILLRREGDRVVVDNDPEIVRGWRVDQVLTSDLFGLHSSRPPRTAALMDERSQLLARGVTTDEDRQRLAELDELLENLPAAERREDRQALQEIRDVAALLRKHAEGQS